MSKYKVGDKVKIREDLVVNNIYGGDSFIIDMADLRGEEVTIKEVEPKFNSYRIKETGYNWTDEMFERLAEEPKPKYVKCITSEFRNITKDEVYEVLKEYYDGYVLEQGSYSKRYFEEVETQIEEISEPMSIPSKGIIKYRITDDGITYTTLNGSKTGKSIKSSKDESSNKIGILLSVARSLGFNEDKISGIVDVLFDDDSYNSKAKCDNAIMNNDIARALSILDKYKEV